MNRITYLYTLFYIKYILHTFVQFAFFPFKNTLDKQTGKNTYSLVTESMLISLIHIALLKLGKKMLYHKFKKMSKKYELKFHRKRNANCHEI